MKKLILAAALCAAAIAPTTASAQDPNRADFKNAAAFCKEFKAKAGTNNFASMFGTKKNAYGKCVSQTAKKDAAQEDDKTNAAKTCKAAKADKEQFAKDYGTGRNAFGKCVSKTAKELAAERKAEREAAPTA